VRVEVAGARERAVAPKAKEKTDLVAGVMVRVAVEKEAEVEVGAEAAKAAGAAWEAVPTEDGTAAAMMVEVRAP